MTELISSDLSDLGLPIQLARAVLLNRGTAAHSRPVRPRIILKSLDERFAALTGRTAQEFLLPIRMFQFALQDTDEVLVEEAGNDRLPLVVRRDGEIVINFDIASVEAFEWRDSQRPIYTYLPGFNIQKIPPAVRRPLSNFLQSLKSSGGSDVVRQYSRLPLTNLEFVILLIQLLAAEQDEKESPLFNWPGGKRAVFVPFHDVDTGGFLKRGSRDPLFLIEQKHKIRSTWFVPTAFLGDTKEKVQFLLQAGHEVGWHGHNHDHRLPFTPFAEQRVEVLRKSWLCEPDNYPTGMRTPRLLKSNHLFELLDRSCSGMRYDTSFLQGIVPYDLWVNSRKTNILEIPITVPTDIVVWNALSGIPSSLRAQKILDAQIARTKKLIEVGGVISIVTHPEADLSEQPALLDVYDQYLAYIKDRSDIAIMTGGELFKHWVKGRMPVDNLVLT